MAVYDDNFRKYNATVLLHNVIFNESIVTNRFEEAVKRIIAKSKNDVPTGTCFEVIQLTMEEPKHVNI